MSNKRDTGCRMAYDYIRTGILNNEFGEGYVFVESEIAVRLGISRTPVREAIRMLQSEKVLANEKGKGIIFRSVSPEEIKAVYQLAGAVEGTMAYHLALRKKVPELEKIRLYVTRMEQALSGEMREDEWAAADDCFHKELLKAGENILAEEVMKRLGFYIEVIRRNYTIRNYHFMFRSTVQHREAYEAIEAGDAEYARVIVQKHWNTIKNEILGEGGKKDDKVE